MKKTTEVVGAVTVMVTDPEAIRVSNSILSERTERPVSDPDDWTEDFLPPRRPNRVAERFAWRNRWVS